jgi:hypothetical protein
MPDISGNHTSFYKAKGTANAVLFAFNNYLSGSCSAGCSGSCSDSADSCCSADSAGSCCFPL